jgi:hypothetical protein
MKITKRQLRQIIKEERTKLLQEQRADSSPNALVDFAIAFGKLGFAAEEQLHDLVRAWNEAYLGSLENMRDFEDEVHRSPAVNVIHDRLHRPLQALLADGDNAAAEELLDVVEEAKRIRDE